MRKERRAKLTINTAAHPANDDGLALWVRLVADNGERLMHSEMHTTRSNAKRSRAAILRAMQDVIEDAGAVVMWPEGKKP